MASPFKGKAGRDYTIVFRGGNVANDPRENVDFAWSVVDLLVLSMRSRKAEIEGRNPYEDKAQRRAFDDAVFLYLGEVVQIEIRGIAVSPDDPDERYPFKAISPPFAFGDLSDFQRMYIKGLIKVLKKLGAKRSPWPIYTRRISIAFADGRKLPGNSRAAARKKLRNARKKTKGNPFGARSGRGKTRISMGKTSEGSPKSSAGRSSSTAKRGPLSQKRGTK